MRRALLRAALLAALPAGLLAAPLDEPHPLTLRLGQELSICKTGTVMCPVSAPICDDLGVATAVASSDGSLAWKGVSLGTTLCSVASAGGAGPRRVYRITVVPPDPAAPRPGGS